ncbi:dynamin family protein [Cryptosporangium japonicum]|uniref:Dynamin N-terminal domain-containing protein n=1 Tax=Cryptosporangium japonicum TaxID=80872 RepID=A0ABN0UHX8_9ACTN
MSRPSTLDPSPPDAAPEPDAGAIAVLPAAVRAAYDAADRTGHRIRLGAVPDFTLVVWGPVDAGKTALVSALLADGVGTLPGLAERPGRATPVPVEYVYGVNPELWLGVGGTSAEPTEWVRAPLDTPDLERFGELRRVRAIVPARALLDWSMRIVDCPGLDTVHDLTGAAADEAGRPDVGVLYVVPRRGITELDAQALEMLRSLPLLLIENRREAEIAGSASTFDELAVPGLDIGPAIPLAVRRLARPGPERTTFLRCVALLRTRTAPDRWTAGLGAAAIRGRESLCGDFARRRTMALMARHPDWLGSLHLLADLVGIERDGPAVIELDDRLAAITRLASAARPVETLRTLLDHDVRATLDRYNGEAVRGVRLPREPVDHQAFGQAYARLRDDLIALLENVLADTALGATDADRAALETVRDEVRDDRLEVAVLGQSSSGKSSLINALLGVRTGAALLPAAPRPTTSTVNRVEYAPRDSLTVEWLPEVELRLLSPGAEPHQLRVHLENIRALGRWLRDRSVAARDCEFRPLASGQSDSDPEAAFWRLWKMLDLTGDPQLYAYLAPSPDRPRITDLSVPAEVRVRRFVSVPDQWPGSLDRERAFADLTRDPALALRVDTLRVGVPHPLLEHVTIVDTPGTDAPVPHHRVTAHRAVRDQRHGAVVYCFDGARPASAEDQANLTYLQRQLDPSRFFFVITRRGVVERDEDRVRETVENVLGETPPRTYFTEVVSELNDDFRALSDDLGRYVLDSRRTLLASWLERAHQVVTDVHGRHVRRIDRVADGEETRRARLDAFRADADELGAVRDAFRQDPEWGEPWLRARVAEALDRGTSRVEHVVHGLTGKRAFAAARDRLGAEIDVLNRTVRELLASDCAVLSFELAARLPGRTVTPPELTWDVEPFGVAEVDHVAATVEWRGGWQRLIVLLDPRRRRSDADANRAAVAEAWARSRDAGVRAVTGAVEHVVGHLHAELARLAEGTAAEVAAAEREPGPDDKVAATEGRDRASNWLRRIDALSRNPQLGGDR